MLHENLLANFRLHDLPLSHPVHHRDVVLVLDENNKNTKVVIDRNIEQLVVWSFQLRSKLSTWHDDDIVLIQDHTVY